MLEEQCRVSACSERPEVSESGQGNPKPGADPDIDNLPERVDEDDDWDFDSAINGEFVQSDFCTRLQNTFYGLATGSRKPPRYTVPGNAHSSKYDIDAR